MNVVKRYLRCLRVTLAACVLAGLAALAVSGKSESYRIGEVEFFGYAGLDLERVRAALPVHEGDAVSEDGMAALGETIKRAVREKTGREPTDVTFVCCDDRGGVMIYVGLAGGSNRPFAFNPAPKGAARLPSAALALYKRFVDAVSDSARTGQTGEDDSKGYALASYPPLRAAQLRIRRYALGHEPLLLGVLASASDAEQRATAAELLGYARQSERQILALVRASRDVDDGVRNNAVRALGVLARSDPKIARRIPAAPFVDMLSSGNWKDRNKASGLLDVLSLTRDRRLLALLRARALDSLVEMARWRSHGHASAARAMLGRIAGIGEERLAKLVATDQVEAIVGALVPSP